MFEEVASVLVLDVRSYGSAVPQYERATRHTVQREPGRGGGTLAHHVNAGCRAIDGQDGRHVVSSAITVARQQNATGHKGCVAEAAVWAAGLRGCLGVGLGLALTHDVLEPLVIDAVVVSAIDASDTVLRVKRGDGAEERKARSVWAGRGGFEASCRAVPQIHCYDDSANWSPSEWSRFSFAVQLSCLQFASPPAIEVAFSSEQSHTLLLTMLPLVAARAASAQQSDDHHDIFGAACCKAI
jgi:hypothetical protein